MPKLGEKLNNGSVVVAAARNPVMEADYVIAINSKQEYVTWAVDDQGNAVSGNYHSGTPAGLRSALDDLFIRASVVEEL